MPVERALEKLSACRVLFDIKADLGDVLAITGFRTESAQRTGESDLLCIGKINLRKHQHTSLLQQFPDSPAN